MLRLITFANMHQQEERHAVFSGFFDTVFHSYVNLFFIQIFLTERNYSFAKKRIKISCETTFFELSYSRFFPFHFVF